MSSFLLVLRIAICAFIIIVNVCKSSNSSSHLDCTSDYSCSETTINASTNQSFIIDCDGYRACSNSIINCPSNRNCHITCDGEESCYNTLINWPSASIQPTQLHPISVLNCTAKNACYGTNFPITPRNTALSLQCTHCTGATITCPSHADCDIFCDIDDSCSDTTIRCHANSTKSCTIYCDSNSSCINTNILVSPTSTFICNGSCSEIDIINDTAPLLSTYPSAIKTTATSVQSPDQVASSVSNGLSKSDIFLWITLVFTLLIFLCVLMLVRYIKREHKDFLEIQPETNQINDSSAMNDNNDSKTKAQNLYCQQQMKLISKLRHVKKPPLYILETIEEVQEDEEDGHDNNNTIDFLTIGR